MQFHRTAVLNRPEATQVSPLIAGPQWFETEPDSWTVRMHLPLTPDLMTAALMGGGIDQGDLGADVPDSELWGTVACVAAAEGLAVVRNWSEELERDETAGDLDTLTAARLAAARRRVAGMTGSGRS